MYSHRPGSEKLTRILRRSPLSIEHQPAINRKVWWLLRTEVTKAQKRSKNSPGAGNRVHALYCLVLFQIFAETVPRQPGLDELLARTRNVFGEKFNRGNFDAARDYVNDTLDDIAERVLRKSTAA